MAHKSKIHRRRIANGVARYRVQKNDSPVAKAIVGSSWATITAYAEHIGKSQTVLSRYMNGERVCPPEVHAAVMRDFPTLRKQPPTKLWPKGLLIESTAA